MTEVNRASAIREEWDRAESALKASSLLAANGFMLDAVSRLYYSTLHRVRALLLTAGLEPRSHEGALRLLSLHFVRPGRLEPATTHLFARLMKYREEADYNPSYAFEAGDVEGLRRDAAVVASRIAEIIQAEGFGLP